VNLVSPDLSVFVRFESARPDVTGRHIGIFGLVNVLGRHGMLTAAEEAVRREANSWLDAAYPDPCTTHPTVYDPEIHPGAAAWFRATATGLLERVPPYLALLDAHAVAWRRVSTSEPGRIIYEDPFQVVALP
jgi:hypothetical protein